MNKHQNLHEYHLVQVVKPKNLETILLSINRSIDDLVFAITEPEYFHDHMDHYPMCDYAFGFYDGLWVPAELKHSIRQYNKAKKQLLYGKKFIEQMMQYSPNRGLLITYEDNVYRTKVIKI